MYGRYGGDGGCQCIRVTLESFKSVEIAKMDEGGVCRLCLSKQNVKYSLVGESGLLFKLRSCLQLTISETDSLPKNICDICSQKITDIYDYYKSAKNAERELLSGLGKIVIDDDDVSIKSEDELKNEDEKTDENRQVRNIKKEPETIDVTNTYGDTEFHMTTFMTKSTQTDCSGISFDTFLIKTIENKNDGMGHVTVKEEVLFERSPSDDLRSDPDYEGSYDDYSSDDDMTLNKILGIPSVKVELDKGYSKTKKSKKVKRKESANSSNERSKHGSKESSIKKKRKISKDKSSLVIKVEKLDQDFVNRVIENGHLGNADDKKWVAPDPGDESKSWQCLTCFAHEKCRADLLKHYREHADKSKKTQKMEAELSIKKELTLKDDDEPMEDSSTKKPKFVYIEPAQNTGEPGYQCVKCSKIFNNKRSLSRHMLCHDDSRPYLCNICGRTYKRAYEILLHGRAHNGIKTLFCQYEQCNYSTVYPGALQTHQKRHAPNFKYTCEVCNKGFDVLTWFVEHKNLHTGDKPFTCDICNKSFVYSRYLTAHRKSVHPETNAKQIMHRCKFCSSEFRCRKQLQRHRERMHTDECSTSVLCDICGKGLSSREHLKFHRRIHTGEKPYPCRTCGKAFAKKCNLILHERVHSGEKPHICSHCGKGFAQRSTLVIHERYHSGARPYVCTICGRGFVAKGLLSMHQKTCFAA